MPTTTPPTNNSLPTHHHLSQTITTTHPHYPFDLLWCQVTLVGMGRTEQGGTGVLKYVNVDTVSQSRCEAAEPSAMRNHWVNYSNVICTGGEAGKVRLAAVTLCTRRCALYYHCALYP